MILERLKNNRIVYIGSLVLTLIFIILIVGFLSLNRVYRRVYVEAGEDLPVLSSFLKNKDIEAAFITDITKLDTSNLGTFDIQIRIGKRDYKSKLIIKDTTAPEARPIDQKIPLGETLDAKSFVKDVIDATAVDISFLEEPDFSHIGKQTVSIVLEDAAGNKTELISSLEIIVVKDELIVEAGTGRPSVDSFMASDRLKGTLVSDISAIDFRVPKEHKIIIEFGGEEYISVLKIQDTIAPRAVAVDKKGWTGDTFLPEDFVANIVDHTDVEVYFKEEPDFNRVGNQKVYVLLKDAGGNITEVVANLDLVKDTEPPVILGDDERLVYIGDTVSYRKHITVTDNRDENVDLQIDSSKVNLKKEGRYEVEYIATDSSGNTSSKTVTYIVKEKPVGYIAEEEVEKLADEILGRILKKGMSPREKARAIYDWIRSHISYSSYENNEDWIRAAYDGIKSGRGDCYVYFGTSKILLNRAGIRNMDIVKINGGHYWNLVDLGEGWYHFDTTPRSTGGEFFMMTDDELADYSRKNRNSHIWDRDKYPKTPKQ